MTGMLLIIRPTTPMFQKICGNCHVANIIIFPTSGIHCSACYSKSKVQKLNFFHGSITTNDELVLLIIKRKCLEVIVHMIESEFVYSLHPKQVQLFISICIHSKFQLLTTSAFINFKKDIQKFIPQP
jgi:hypothetical protein